ncbi:extended synaptotagmin-2-like isoform X2 [Sycon ciliatum]|uniref:extended synaptotagmin-2-like isoform X2 n=1 Tax=Sycon ciliatum TaxID=27933 RepID=UPI0031F62ED0
MSEQRTTGARLRALKSAEITDRVDGSEAVTGTTVQQDTTAVIDTRPPEAVGKHVGTTGRGRTIVAAHAITAAIQQQDTTDMTDTRPPEAVGKHAGRSTGRDRKTAAAHALTAARRGELPLSRFTGGLSGVLVRFTFVLFIWLLGACGFSWLWLVIVIGGVVHWEKRRQRMLRQATLSEHRDDSGLILAHMHELPSWVTFPDVTRVEWINTIVSRVWPYLEPAIKKILVEKIEPILKNKCPGPLKSIEFRTVKLGCVSPKITGIKVYPQQSVDQREIIIDIDVAYNGTAIIELFIAYGLSAGVSDLRVQGKLRIILKPLMPVLPILGGISIFFLEKPMIEFDLLGLANIFDMPVLRNAIDAVIDEKLSETLVFPSRFFLSLVPDSVDVDCLLYPLPSHFLCVTVVEAKNVEGMDFHLFSASTSDIYVIVKVGQHQFRTSVRNDSVAAQWNESFETLLDSHEEPNVLVEVWDQEDLTTDQLIGKCTVAAVDVRHCSDMWLDIRANQVMNSRGNIRMKFFWRRIASPAESVTLFKEFARTERAVPSRGGGGSRGERNRQRGSIYGPSAAAATARRAHSLHGGSTGQCSTPGRRSPDDKNRRRQQRAASAPSGLVQEQVSSSRLRPSSDPAVESARRPSMIDRLKERISISAVSETDEEEEEVEEEEEEEEQETEGPFEPFVDLGIDSEQVEETVVSPAVSSVAAISYLPESDAQQLTVPVAVGMAGLLPAVVGVSNAEENLDMPDGVTLSTIMAMGRDEADALTEDQQSTVDVNVDDIMSLLHVRIVKAEEISHDDVEQEREYFCRLIVQNSTKDGPHARGTSTVAWNTCLHFPLTETRNQVFRAEVCTTPDTLLGYCEFSLDSLLEAASLVCHRKLPLTSTTTNDGTAGTGLLDIRLSLRALAVDDNVGEVVTEPENDLLEDLKSRVRIGPPSPSPSPVATAAATPATAAELSATTSETAPTATAAEASPSGAEGRPASVFSFERKDIELESKASGGNTAAASSTRTVSEAMPLVVSIPEVQDKFQQRTSPALPDRYSREVKAPRLPVNRYPIRHVTESALELSFRYSHLKHRLFVNVHRASSLVPCHVDGTSDPFVEAYVQPEVFGLGRRRTSTRRKECNPVFDESFQYPIPFSSVSQLSVVLTVRNSPFRFGAFREHMGEVSSPQPCRRTANTQRCGLLDGCDQLYITLIGGVLSCLT